MELEIKTEYNTYPLIVLNTPNADSLGFMSVLFPCIVIINIDAKLYICKEQRNWHPKGSRS